jgi:nitric oxide reductase NorE protein
MWVFISGDLTVFGIFFVLFLFYRDQDLATFRESQLALNQYIGLINTLLLLTSSWFVARAMNLVRCGQSRDAARLIAFALLCGAGFLLDKIVEWSHLIGEHKSALTDYFYLFYFMLTGIHAFHVLIGMVILVFQWRSLSKGADIGGRYIATVENGALFWHLVDLLWIALFALLYLV